MTQGHMYSIENDITRAHIIYRMMSQGHIVLTILQGQKADILNSQVSFTMTMKVLLPGILASWYLTHCSPDFRFVRVLLKAVLNCK